jgi:hypothetical protein
MRAQAVIGGPMQGAEAVNPTPTKTDPGWMTTATCASHPPAGLRRQSITTPPR